MKDITVSIRNWFNSEECISLPVTDVCSASFWRSEPTQYHSFDTITVINDNLDTEDSDSENDVSDSSSEIDGEEELHDDNFYNVTLRRPVPLSRIKFQTATEWQFYDQSLHEGQDCVICHNAYLAGQRITKLLCNHQYHTHCIETWLTQQSDHCPYCRTVVG